MKIKIKQIFNRIQFATTEYEVSVNTILVGYAYTHYMDGQIKWYFKNDNGAFGQVRNRNQAINSLIQIAKYNKQI